MTRHEARDDDAIRARLRSADPASSLAPLRGDQLTRLTEDTMNTTTPTAERHDRADIAATRSRLRRLWPIGAAAGVLGAAAIAVPLALAPAAAVTELDQPVSGGATAMCAVITSEAIAATDSSFRASVRGIEDGVVTLSVTERFHGEVEGTVTVAQGDGVPIDGGPLVFDAGSEYLISTVDGVIQSCGISDEASPELEALYAAAHS